MRRRARIVMMWLVLTATAAREDEDGGIADEGLVTAGMIVAGIAFMGWVTFKVVPFISNLDLPSPFG